MGRRNKTDLTGKHFGNLTAVSEGPSIAKSAIHLTTWVCVRVCGKCVVCRAGNLKSGKHKSCGCLRFVRRPDAAIQRAVVQYRKAAKLRGLSFSLSFEDCQPLFAATCYCCGAQPQNTVFAQTVVDHRTPVEMFIALCRRVAARHLLRLEAAA